jgi:V-type H+-transporting ATPase subunit a
MQSLHFQHIVGVVLQEDKPALERMIFRTSRGNCYVRFSNIDEPLQNEKGQLVSKVVFIIFYRSAALTPKLRRICDAFAANRHEIPEFESQQKVCVRVAREGCAARGVLWRGAAWRAFAYHARAHHTPAHRRAVILCARISSSARVVYALPCAALHATTSRLLCTMPDVCRSPR